MHYRILIVLLVAVILLGFTAPRQHSVYVPFVFRETTLPVACIGQIQCVVYEDTNGNSRRDPNEPGISDVSLTLQSLDRDRGQELRTDSNGECRIGVRPGRYALLAEPLNGYRLTTPDVWGIDIVCETVKVTFGMQPTAEDGSLQRGTVSPVADNAP